LVAFLAEHQIDAEFLAPGVPTPTVLAAAAAIGVPESQILKTLLFTGDGAYVVAIANGTRRVNRALLAQAAGLPRLRAADPATVLAVTGFPAGGVSPIGLPAALPVIVDPAVAALPVAYGGGGSEDLLLRLKPADFIRLNGAVIAAIVEGG
jgi:Cys-tRNA(Pro) deacylase